MNTNLANGFWYESVDSTMDEAKRLIESGQIKDIAFIVANHQTSGRGTRGRKWESPKDSGIYLSLVHLPKEGKYLEASTIYTKAAGIACIEAIKEVTYIEAKLKPINDIYFNNKKLGGILVESKLHKAGISSLITGVGINIKKIKTGLPSLLDRDIVEPISLEEIMNATDFKTFSKKKLIEAIVNKICFWYERVFEGKQDLVHEKWESYK